MSERPSRVVIENVMPEVDAGRFPIKRCPGEDVVVRACIHADSADILAACVLFKKAGEKKWQESPMRVTNAGLDLWEGRFKADGLDAMEYLVQGWVDSFATWRRGLEKKAAAGQDVGSDLLEGAQLVQAAAARVKGKPAEWLRQQAAWLSAVKSNSGDRVRMALDPELLTLMSANADRDPIGTYRTLTITMEPTRARFGAWYELFPRSASPDPKRPGRLSDVEARLPALAALGFDILYLPPIHPIGKTHRKGPNNAENAGPQDVGSPWAIGSSEGGHTAIDPSLGTLQDFDRLIIASKTHGIQVALDLALQCSPDHPYVREHPEWFRHRPDGSIKYAENPPKKYEDIYPFDFEGSAWESLWKEIRSVVLFWVQHGVKVFRVDNPHTKPYRFWEWLIQEIKRESPDVIFLAEAFTRPPVMRYLAKCGFSQSYTYFTWRNTKAELTEYLTELTQTDVHEYMRPNFFTNTPDILSPYLQTGGRAAFMIRLILAATLSATYGICGPTFELCEADALPGTEDYRDSEKYQVRYWDWEKPGNIKDLIARVNRIRRENTAFQFNTPLQFVPISSESLLAFVKTSPDGANRVLVIINLDPHAAHEGNVTIAPAALGLPDAYEVEDLLSGARYTWHGTLNYVKLAPQPMPAHIFKISHA
jgi:starch synthase (maltosyl-transferring)